MSRSIPSRWAPYVEACAGGAVPPVIQAKAISLVAGAAAAHVSRLAKSLPRRRDEAAEEAREFAEHQRLVARVRDRDANLCQLCPLGTPAVRRRGTPHDPIDPHHLEPGPTKRKNERLSNMLCAHRSCHDAYHSNAKAFIPAVKAFCARNGYPLPRRKEFR